jgi:hypothetical protein
MGESATGMIARHVDEELIVVKEGIFDTAANVYEGGIRPDLTIDLLSLLRAAGRAGQWSQKQT